MAQTFLRSNKEYPSPERDSIATANRSIQKLKTKLRFDDPSSNQLQNISQRSENFTTANKRQAKSLQRGAFNPMHFKRSLPEILQTKDSKNAAGIVKIDKR